VYDLIVDNLRLRGQIEESRRGAELCVSAAAAQFGSELRLREAAHEQTLEAIITRFAEKEAARAIGVAANAGAPGASIAQVEQGTTETTFATVTRRNVHRQVERVVDRSRSRATKRNRLLKEGKKEEHMPSYVLETGQGKSITEVKELIWNQVAAKKVRPKCHTVTTKTGKCILKPSDKETADVLKHLSKVSSLLTEESLKWPRVVIRGVSSDMELVESIQNVILEQNPELGIPPDAEEVVIRPAFKSGPRGRSTTNWVVEVNPKYLSKIEETTLYLGFMICRTSPFEEVTQCHMCLRYGHPAAKCHEKETSCAHCGRKGHKAAECPAAEADPICTNCKGKHNARDRTCSTRTAYLMNQIRRTDYGVSQ